MSVQSVTNSTGTTSSTTSSTSLGSAGVISKDAFLQILVSQLKYQDPMDPMKADQFMSQLAQLTSVEQLQNISNSLDAMKTAAEKGNISQWVSAIGKKMQVDSTTLSKGDEVTFTPQANYDQVVLAMQDTTTGDIKQVTLNKGESLTYNYQGDNSVVFAAKAFKSGQEVALTSSVYRVVAGIQSSDTGFVMVSGSGETYSTDKIKQIKQ
jgi:flagellar basal-body rod modification protein FlgD